MNDIINEACSYFGRISSSSYDLKVNNWNIIRKELARVNIDSMVVEIKIDYQTELIFPFIIKRNTFDKYTLVYSLSRQGLHSSEAVISFNEFRQKYSNKFMILEAKPFIKPRSTYLLKIINEYQNIIDPIFLAISILLLIIWFTIKENIVPILSIGLLLSWYYKSFENRGNYTSQFCIERGVFSCKKSNLYEVYGLSFSELGIIYFLGSILALGIAGFSFVYLIIALFALLFCLNAFFLLIYREKKICIICSGILGTIFVNFVFCIFFCTSKILLSNEILTMLSYFFVFYFIVSIVRIKDVSDNSKVRDFNIVMSEWPIIKGVSKSSELKLIDSEILIGNSYAKRVVQLVIYLGCKYCTEALREMINLVLMDDSYCLHLYIKSNGQNIDIIYYSKIISACEKGDFSNVYYLYMEWKSNNSKSLKSTFNNEKLQQHLELIKDAAITQYPSIFYDNVQISNFARFDNIKVAMKNYLIPPF